MFCILIEEGGIVHSLVAIGVIILIARSEKTILIFFMCLLYFYSNNYDVLAGLSFIITDPGNIYRHIIRFKSWPSITRYKKHKAEANCNDVPNNIVLFRNT